MRPMEPLVVGRHPQLTHLLWLPCSLLPAFYDPSPPLPTPALRTFVPRRSHSHTFAFAVSCAILAAHPLPSFLSSFENHLEF